MNFIFAQGTLLPGWRDRELINSGRRLLLNPEQLLKRDRIASGILLIDSPENIKHKIEASVTIITRSC